MPDQFGNPTEEELRGTFTSAPNFSHLPQPGSPEYEANLAARNAQVYSNSQGRGYTVDTMGPDGPVRQTGVAAPFRTGANAPAYQSLDPNNPLLPGDSAATNRDLLGGGAFGIRRWMRDHPVGVILGTGALAAGGAALAGGFGGGAGAAGGAAGGAAAPAGASITAGEAVIGGAGAAGTSALNASVPSLAPLLSGASSGFAGYGSLGGFQPNSGLGVFANGGQAGMAGVGGGNAGALAASGALSSTPGWLSTATQYADELGSLLSAANGGGSGGGGQIPLQMPSIGMMGSSVAPPTNRQSSPLNQSFTRFRGYGRKPMQFRGATIWV
jgi:hypothetical protein